MKSIMDMFTDLGDPPKTDDIAATFSVLHITGRPDALLAKDQAGNPAVLFSLNPDGHRGPKLRFNLDHISVDHDVSCSIYEDNGDSVEARFTIIRCQNADEELKLYFLRLASLLIDSLSLFPTYLEIERAVSFLLELFAATKRTPLKSIRGLWAELLTIAESKDPKFFLLAWRCHDTNRHDFGYGHERVEVKSTSGRIRQHHFGLEQLEDIGSDRIVVTSLFVEEHPGGTSVAELTDEIAEYVSDSVELKWKLESNVAQFLGSGWASASTMFFDRALAKDTIQYFWASQIPRPSLPENGNVHSVRFVADLSSLQALEHLDFDIEEASLFSSLG